MVESSALLKRRSPKGYRGFESLPHRASREVREVNNRARFGSLVGAQSLRYQFMLPQVAPLLNIAASFRVTWTGTLRTNSV